MPPDSTASLRRTCYAILTVVAVALAAGRIAGVENLYEPSRYKPAAGKFGADRVPLAVPARAWPAERPEPTPMFSSNDRSRWATVRALVDHGTFAVGRRINFRETQPPFQDEGIIFEGGWEAVDKVMDPNTGLFYSTKPPLFSVMVAAEYWVLKHTLGWSFNRDKWPIVVTGLLTVNVLPFAIYLILLARLIEDYGANDFAKLVTFAAAAFGTFVTTFSLTLNNHTPAVFCALFALYPLLRKRPEGTTVRPLDLALSGFFAGLTATFELPAASFAAAIGFLLLLSRPKDALAAYLPGALVPVVALLACNYWAMGTLSPAYAEFGNAWYRYPGSHWLKVDDPNARGIDFNRQPTTVYAFNLLLGHHGWFSLTPVWVIGLFGLVSMARSASEPRIRWLGRFTLLVSAVVFAFYLTRTQSYNYGGNTAAARWLIWLTPAWLFGLLAGAAPLAQSRFGRGVVLAALGFSVLAVFYPVANPWRSPWLLQLAETLDWVHYG
jgi:hypothetical protein